MTNARAGDVPALLRHFGRPITVGLTTVNGLIDRRGEPLLGTNGTSAVGSTEVVVTLQQGSLPGLELGGPITVDGAAMIVAAIRPIDDGELLEVRVVFS